MAKRAYRTKKFNTESLILIEHCDSIVNEYLEQGLRLTLRQLYYQLVSRNIIPNVERSYKRLSSIVSDARLAGLLDWEAIEDRGRQPRAASEFENLRDLAEAAARSYRLPRWKTQSSYVELWVEKDALAGVLWPIAREYHVTLMVNKGYSSQSAMHESAQRFLEGVDKIANGMYKNSLARTLARVRGQHPAIDESGKLPAFLLYLGDHDPSGEDMVRDIEDRLTMFGAPVRVFKVALTMDQILEHDPPPNPAKLTDPRAAKYIEKFGDESWEVDALPPDVLAEIIREYLDRIVNKKKMQAVLKQEEQDKKRLLEAVSEL